MNDIQLKTVVGLFDNLSDARNAVHELHQGNFRRDDINLVAHAGAEEYGRYFSPEGSYVPDAAAESTASGAAAGAGVGAILGALGGLVLGLSLIPVPGVGPIVAAGPLASALTGAGVGAIVGGLIGALTGVGVPEEHAGYYAEGVRRGGGCSGQPHKVGLCGACGRAAGVQSGLRREDHGRGDVR